MAPAHMLSLPARACFFRSGVLRFRPQFYFWESFSVAHLVHGTSRGGMYVTIQ